MHVTKKIALGLGVLVVVCALLVGIILIRHMSEYPSRWMSAGVILFFGAAVGWVVYHLVLKLPDTRKARIILLTVACAIVLVPVLSMFIPGRITYSRFGFTMYGLVPVPALDITVGTSGVLGFRDKTHRLTLDEVRPYLKPGVVIVIGAGWNNVVQVDPAVRDLKGYDIRISPTPEAFELFNRLKSEGKNVVLIAHSTC